MMARELDPQQLRAVCDAVSLPFRSTEELSPLDGMIGQDRALAATTFGVGMKHPGYNFFVLGPAATGKTTAMLRVLGATAEQEAPGSDYCYVHNFLDPYRPTVLALPAGRGCELRDEMARFVAECAARLPRAFESEEFARQRSAISDEMERRMQVQVAALDQAARGHGFVVVRTPGGLAVAPAPAGKPISHDEYHALPEAVKQKLAAGAAALEDRLEAALRQHRELEREGREAHARLVKETAQAATRMLIQELRERFAGLEAVHRYLDEIERDVVAHAEQFRAPEDPKPALPFFVAPPEQFLDRYRVNVLIDRRGERGAPVVFEPNPTYGNLLGRIEHRIHFGSLVTDFTLIKPGALHRANGGYLILEAHGVLTNFMAWDALKRALKSGAVQIREPLEEFRLASAATLAPEPIPLAVKVVLIGTPLVYYLLHALDEDFRELFKVKVDFDGSLARTPESELLYARFVAGACRREHLPHFSAGGVAALIEHSARLVANQRRLSSRLGALLDIVREAAFWAGQRGQALVDTADVTRAIEHRVYRVNLLEERVARMIAEGDLLIATEGESIGQLNGIAVLAAGDHAFGKPTRITARTFAGEPGVLDIEREAKLGGPIHSKGVMILTGFLAGRYARERPLALAATIAFEQQYEEIEGDSASAAELLALLSSLAGVPLSQSIAVTGSVNQQGEVQAVGGINEKVEGFFDVCRARGLTGREGVVIPAANTLHLMLREDVVAAVRDGHFHVFVVTTVDEALALLSGLEAGARGPDGQYPAATFNGAVEQALAQNLERLRELHAERPAPDGHRTREPVAPVA
jgi:lon-related putative ATP-dependent protease